MSSRVSLLLNQRPFLPQDGWKRVGIRPGDNADIFLYFYFDNKKKSDLVST
jgi:hypothetical protein